MSGPALQRIRGLGSKLLDAALPGRCAGCGVEGAALCVTCEPALDARLQLPAGTPIGLPADLPPPLLQLEWCAPFAGTVRRALHDLKYAGEQRLAEPLGRAIARRWARVGAGGEVVVPVPVHRDRERRRGYDQAALIAAVAGRELGMPVARIVERAKATAAQYELDRAQRAANVRGAFAMVPLTIPPRPSRGPPLAGRWILLVDDVVTTGSTLVECGRVLLGAGAIGVSAITVARER